MEQFDFTILRELRKRAGLSIGEVSAESGVSAAVISKLERNRTRAELDTLYRLARVFGITAAELLNLAEARLSHPLKATAHRNEDFLFREINYKKHPPPARQGGEGVARVAPERASGRLRALLDSRRNAAAHAAVGVLRTLGRAVAAVRCAARAYV
ncbi:MAG: helix-turn-helix transcriptional regulator [Victivallis sp.]